MPNSKIPSPARSQGVIRTPRRHRFKRSRSIGSPARSTTSTKLSYIAEEYRMAPFVSSPLRTRRSVLSDNTDIEIPGRRSWYKRLDDNTGEATEVLENGEQVGDIEEYIDAEILSQEKKNFTIDLPESSDGESISSIVIPQRKLFSLKDNLQAQKLFNNVIENRENFTLRKSKCNNDKTIIVGKKELFNRGGKAGSKTIFSANMQNISVDNTLTNKNKEIENPVKVRNFFGNRVASKRKNMFAEFIVSESEDEIPDIQPKVFGFTTNNEQQKPQTTKSRQSTIQKVQNTSISSFISNDEIGDWKLLPSSTMVENQFGISGEDTPVKRVRLSEKHKAKALEEDTSINELNNTKQSIVTHTVKNALRSKLTNDEQFIVSQQSNINQSKNSESTQNKSSLTKNNNSKNMSNNERSINIIKITSSNLYKTEDRQKLQNSNTATSQSSSHDYQKDTSAEDFENDDVDNNDFALQYENDDENLVENAINENNVTKQRFENGNKGTGCNNEIILASLSGNNTTEINLIKPTNTSMNDNIEKQEAISKNRDTTLVPSQDLNENSRDPTSIKMQSEENCINSSKVATNVQKSNINEELHLHKLKKKQIKPPDIMDNVEENNGKRNCSSHNLDHENMKNLSTHLERDTSNINKSPEYDTDGKISIQSNVETVINGNDKENSAEINQSAMKLKENQENVNFEDSVEENIDCPMNESNNDSEVEDEIKNDENNESSKNITEVVGNEEEDELNATEIDTSDQEDVIENEREDESGDDDIGNSNTGAEEQQEENNESNATEIDQDCSSKNEKLYNEEDNEVYHEYNAGNSEDCDDDGESEDEMQYESDEKTYEQNTNTTIKGQRISRNSGVSEQSSRMSRDDVTVETDHEQSRTHRRATLEKYLMNMKKANMERRHLTEEAIRNSIKSSAPLRESNLFKVPAKPKSSSRAQTKTSLVKPKIKHLSCLENLPMELLEDLQYKPPRRYQPSNASWITKRLYKYLEDKLEPKYDYKARVRAEKLVETINNFTRDLRRHSVAPPDAVAQLKMEMARLGVTNTHYDFYEFFHEFMPREIRVKVVPDVVNKISLPKHGVFSDILS